MTLFFFPLLRWMNEWKLNEQTHCLVILDLLLEPLFLFILFYYFFVFLVAVVVKFTFCRMVAHRDKTLPRIQNTSQNPKTLPRIQKHFPESKNTSQNPKTLPRIRSRFFKDLAASGNFDSYLLSPILLHGFNSGRIRQSGQWMEPPWNKAEQNGGVPSWGTWRVVFPIRAFR